MYIVRETFTAKPGHAGKLARMMKDEMQAMPDFKARILLDFVTDYNQIVAEYEVASLADFEKMMTDYKAEQAKTPDKDKPPAYTELYQTGKREIFKVVE